MVHLSYLGRIKAAQINFICMRMNVKFRGRGGGKKKKTYAFHVLKVTAAASCKREGINRTDLEAGWG